MLEIIICVIVADFLTGLIHWAEDCYGLPTWPLIGKAVIVPNIEHHQNPILLTMGTIISRNYQPFLIVLFIVFLFYMFGLLSWHVLLVGFLASLGNEVHAWNHKPPKENPWFVNFLHDIGLIQNRRQHAKHHKIPYNKYYCTLTNFTNEVLETINFWRGLEYLLSKMGIKPKRMTAEREYV